jgi:L-iditol 2-dehydrogenase
MEPLNEMSLPTQMRAVVWFGPGDVRVENRPVPHIKPGQSLVKVALSGICATDRELIDGRLPGISPGVIPGHEITGTIVSGAKGHPANIGDRVVVDTYLPCDRCELCREGRPEYCLDPGELGFTSDGGWAEYVLVSDNRLHAIPDSISDAEAVIAEPFAMTLGAFLDCGRSVEGQNVLIIGSGMAAVGFACSAIAQGALHVQVCLKSNERAPVFQRINPRIDIILSENIRPGAADVGIDSIGSPKSIQSAIYGTRRKGLVICYGLSHQVVDAFPLGDVVLRNITLAGHTNPHDVWPILVTYLRDGLLSTGGFVDGFISIDEVPERMMLRSKALRTVIDMRAHP